MVILDNSLATINKNGMVLEMGTVEVKVIDSMLAVMGNGFQFVFYLLQTIDLLAF